MGRPSKPTLVWTPDQEKALTLLQGPARHTMLYGGSRSGKSLLLVAAIVHRALKAPGSRHVIFRHRFNAVVSSIGMDSLPTVMAKRFPGIGYRIDRTRWIVTLRGGSEIWLGGLDDKERTEKILGQEYSTLFFNESSQISYEAVLMARTRLAQKTVLTNRAYYDCNPAGSRHWSSLLFISKKDPGSRPIGAPLSNPDNYASMQMNPAGNAVNLSEDYMAELDAMPERQRRRFRDGLPTAELDNALWRPEFWRHVAGDPVKLAEECDRVVVAVDPSGASGAEDKRSDEIGIVVVGRRRGEKNRFVVLADRTMRGSPQQWAATTVNTFRLFKADQVIAEKNFGGALVGHTIRMADPNVPVKEVTASRGKAVRADPVAALYEQGRVDHVEKGLEELEDQCLNMSPAGYHGERSPDRVDALVWGLSELSQVKTISILSSSGEWI